MLLNVVRCARSGDWRRGGGGSFLEFARDELARRLRSVEKKRKAVRGPRAQTSPFAPQGEAAALYVRIPESGGAVLVFMRRVGPTGAVARPLGHAQPRDRRRAIAGANCAERPHAGHRFRRRSRAFDANAVSEARPQGGQDAQRPATLESLLRTRDEPQIASSAALLLQSLVEPIAADRSEDASQGQDGEPFRK